MAAATTATLPAARGLLGRSINSLSYSSQSVAVPMAAKTTQWTIPGSTITYDVPENVQVHYTNRTDHDSITSDGGEELTQKLDADASLQGKYMAVSGKLAVKASLSRELKQTGMYAYVTSIYERYNAVLDFGHINAAIALNPALLVELSSLPATFDANDDANYQAFYNFVHKWGTHLVTGITYGQRYTLKSETLTNDAEVKKNFEVNVKAAYSTVLNNVQADANVKASEEFKKFENSTHYSTQILGGDSLKHANLEAHPLDSKAFVDWSSSPASPGQETPLCVEVQPLYEFIATYGPPAARGSAAIIQKVVELFISPHVISTGPGKYDGPCIWQASSSGPADVRQVKLSFSGDPFFRIWRKENPYKVYDTHISLSDSHTVTDNGKTFTWHSRGGLAGGVGYYHGGCGLEYCYTRPVDVQISCTSAAATFYYGEPQPSTTPQGKNYNGYAAFQCPRGETKDWKRQDMRTGPKAPWSPSMDGN